MTMYRNPDTDLPTEFWQEHTHLFIAAHWGPEYCRCCTDREKVEIHQVEVDRATVVGNCTGYRVRGEQVQYAVTAWNDEDTGGGGCSYAAKPSYEEALAQVDDLRANGDPGLSGRVYQHFQIEERRYYTAVDTNVVVIS
jgi:hypothetical protein